MASNDKTPKKLKKVSEAEVLATKPKEEEIKTQAQKDEYQTRLEKAIKIYKELCLNPVLSAADKIEVLASFLKFVPGEGREMLIRWRDTIPFVAGKELEELIKVLVLVTGHPGVDSHERCITAVTLYNRAFLNVCFRCFEAIAVDKSVLVTYRVDASRYLFGSEMEEYRGLAQECLTDIIEDFTLPSEYRYGIIAGFISKTGLATYLNKNKIKIPYDEDFIYGLQSIFFYSDRNGVRERILSGQHLLQMDCVDSTEKTEVGEILLGLAAHKDFDENTRADAADVILRLGQGLQVERAREIITSLGYSAVGGNSKGVLGKVRTVYNNSQNAHNEKISESVAKFIEKMIKDSENLRPYHEIQQEVTAVINLLNLEKSQKLSAYNALNRISVDTAMFTKYKITISEIFVRVWLRIQKHSGETRDTLQKRMIEELVDMGNTCSSGHSGRFVNVLSAVDNELRIGFEDQIVANVAGRISARVRDLPDQDFRASVSLGMTTDGDDSDRDNYRAFIEPTLKELYSELYTEFVGDRYVTAEQFEAYFKKARDEWMSLLQP
jgi:hypothetical protein